MRKAGWQSIDCSGFVPCELSWNGTVFPRIPFPVGFQVCIGHRRCFASDLEGRSEGAAMFSLPGGTCRAAGEYCHLTCRLGLLVRGSTQTLIPPARSPLSASLSPGPGVSAALSQRAPGSPAGHLAMKERQMEVPGCLCSVCLSCAYSLLNCPSGWPQRLQAQPWTLGRRYTQGAPAPHPGVKTGPYSISLQCFCIFNQPLTDTELHIDYLSEKR